MLAECNFPRLWPLVDTVQTNHYRLSTLSTTYIGLEKKVSTSRLPLIFFLPLHVVDVSPSSCLSSLFQV